MEHYERKMYQNVDQEKYHPFTCPLNHRLLVPSLTIDLFKENIMKTLLHLLSHVNYSNCLSKYVVGILAVLMLLFPAYGYCFDFGKVMDDVGSAVKSGIDTVGESVGQLLPGEENETTSQGPATTQQQDKQNPKNDQMNESVAKESEGKSVPAGKTKGIASTSGGTGGSVFSNDPINPAEPPSSKASFIAGDKIYGMLKAAKPWKELNKNNNYIIVWLYIDGKQKVYKSIGLNRPELIALDYFIIDVAPDPSLMTNYTDRDIVFPEKDGYKFGPELFTKYLSELTPGEHSFRLEVKAYNKVYASGEFSISGNDYSAYSSLLADIKDSGNKQQKMPKPGMTDMALQDEMIALLKNAGWNDIRRLVIVDKDWWIDRVAGGDSAVESRHIEGAAAAKDTNGSFYFKHVTFHQPMLITGDWGKLELTHTGEQKMISEDNINK